MTVNRNIFYTFFTQIPTLILGIASGVLITRIIGAAGKGILSTFQSDIELFILILNFSIPGAIVYFISANKIEFRKLLGICILLFASGLLLLFSVLSFLKLNNINSFIFPENHNTWFYVFYICISYALGSFNAVMAGIFQGRNLFSAVNKILLANSILNITIFFSAFIYHNKIENLQLKSVFLLTALIVFINSFLWIKAYFKHIRILPAFNFSIKKDLRPLFNFILLDHTGQLVNFLNYRLDIWIINYFLADSRELGYYNVAVSTAQSLWLISTPIATVLIPHLSANNDDKNKLFGFYSRFNFSLSLLLIAVAILLAPVLIPFLYGGDFSNSVAPFLILLGGVLFYSANKIFAAYIYSCGKVNYNLIVAVIGLVFTISFDLFLIPTLGITGAAIASSVSYFSMFIMTSLFLFFAIKLEFKNFFIITLFDLKEIQAKTLGLLKKGQKN